MKFIAALLLTALCALVAGLYLSWWSIAPAAFLVALLIRQSPFRAWVAGFLGIFACWSLLAIWINAGNNGLLAEKIARILPLNGSVLLLILISALLGAIIGGMGALTGSLLQKRLQKEPQ